MIYPKGHNNNDNRKQLPTKKKSQLRKYALSEWRISNVESAKKCIFKELERESENDVDVKRAREREKASKEMVKVHLIKMDLDYYGCSINYMYLCI